MLEYKNEHGEPFAVDPEHVQHLEVERFQSAQETTIIVLTDGTRLRAVARYVDVRNNVDGAKASNRGYRFVGVSRETPEVPKR